MEGNLTFKAMSQQQPKESKQNLTSQCTYLGLRTIVLLTYFCQKPPFHIKEFLNEIFCNYLFIMFKIALIRHIFCVSHF